MEANEQNVAPPEKELGGFEEPDYAELVALEPQLREKEEEPPPAPPAPVPPSTEAAAPTPPTPPVEPPVVPSAPVAAVGTPPAAPVVEPPAQPAAPAPEPPQPAVDPAEMLRQIDEALLKRYTLDPEEAGNLDKLDARPSEYLPKMLAKVHREAFVSATEAAMARVPEMVAQVLQQRAREQELETQFYTRWGELKGQEQVVIPAIQALRTLNPQIAIGDLIEQAGAIAMVRLGKGVQAPTPPAAPASNVTPFRPMAPGGGGSPPPPKQSADERMFAEMYEEHLRG